MESVKFIAVGNTKSIADYYKYVEKTMMNINMQRHTDSFQLDIDQGIIS